MDQATAERIATALENIAADLKGMREKYDNAALHVINEKMLAQLERAESGVAAPTLVFPGGKPGH